MSCLKTRSQCEDLADDKLQLTVFFQRQTSTDSTQQVCEGWKNKNIGEGNSGSPESQKLLLEASAVPHKPYVRLSTGQVLAILGALILFITCITLIVLFVTRGSFDVVNHSTQGKTAATDLSQSQSSITPSPSPSTTSVLPSKELDGCESIDCGTGQCVQLPSGGSHECKCPDGVTQQEPCDQQEVEPEVSCGGQLEGTHGEFSSPNYPMPYPNNITCKWTIRGGAGKVIKLSFLDFDLEDSSFCVKDYLRVYEGTITGAPVLDKCGTDLPGYIASTDTSLTIEFHSDTTVTEAGFKAMYTVSDHVTPCSRVVCDHNGTCVDDGAKDDDYHCECVAGWKGDHCEEYDSCVDAICQADRPSTFLKTYCRFSYGVEECYCDHYDHEIPRCPTVTHGGKHITVNQDKPRLIGSPNWPDAYPTHQSKVYILRTEPGRSLNVTVLYVSLKGYSDDSLYIYDGNGTAAPLLTQLSSQYYFTKVNYYVSSGHVMTLMFKSSSYVYYYNYGFLVAAESVKSCSEDLNATLVSKTHKMTSSEKPEVCSYTVTSSSSTSGVEVTILSDMIFDAHDCEHVRVQYTVNGVLRSYSPFCGGTSLTFNTTATNQLKFKIKTTSPSSSELVMTYREIPDPDDCEGNPCPEGLTCLDGRFTYTCRCQSSLTCHDCAGARCSAGGFCLFDDTAKSCTCAGDTAGIPSCTDGGYITTSGLINLKRNDVELISSPNWPANYSIYDRVFTISSPEGTGVRAEVLDLELVRSYLEDNLKFYDSSSLWNIPIEVLKGENKPRDAIISSRNFLKIEFNTFYSSFRRGRGFLIALSAVDPGFACESNPCENGGTCNTESDAFNYTCFCPSGFGGSHCQIPGCGGTVTSQETPQEISVNLTETDDTVICVWNITSPDDSRIVVEFKDDDDTDFTVSSGDEIIDTLFEDEVMSTTNQMSISFTSFMSYYRYGNEQHGFSFHHVFDGDECASSPCEAGATCIDGSFNYTCACANGTLGDRCQYVDHCFDNPCSSNAECSNSIYLDKAICSCKPGYGGDTCQYHTGCDVTVTGTRTKQHIINEKLSYHETCSFTFLAPPGHEAVIIFEDVQLYFLDVVIFGDGSRYGPLSNLPDHVITTGGKFTMEISTEGYSSTTQILMAFFIDEDACESSPCVNGATCKDELEGYTCQCTEQWYGPNCTKYNNCYPDPCEHGTCTDGDDTYTCSCDDKYMGTNCTEINPGCADITCQNGGRCLYINETNNADCVCGLNFAGRFCENSTCGVPHIEPQLHHRAKRIVGGREARPHSWPWQVSLRTGSGEWYVPQGRHKCGGSLISNDTVITAGHCEPKVGDKMYIGAHNKDKCEKEEGCRIVTITAAWSEKDYHLDSEGVPHNDVAIAWFSPPVTFGDKISPLCLPEPDDVIPIGTICYTTGWGDGSDSDLLYQTPLEWLAPDECEKNINPGFEPEDMVCAGHVDKSEHRGTCHGDSGGPLVCQVPGQHSWKMFGITSWGRQCDDGKNPGGFTKVLHHLNHVVDSMTERVFKDYEG